jgi:uncharacterized protein YpiB (UPF0302 family)
MSEQQAMRQLHGHLEEAIGVDDATVVVDRVERAVSEEYLDRTLDRALEQQSAQLTGQLTGQLSSLWRRDLLLVMTGQFVALAGVLTAIS